jgi:transcriptional regulatory protein LevR
LDGENSKHVGLAQESDFALTYLHTVCQIPRLVKRRNKTVHLLEKSVIDEYDMTPAASPPICSLNSMSAVAKKVNN